MQSGIEPVILKAENNKENNNPPGLLIAQMVAGVNAGQTITTDKKELDDRNSCIHGGSVFAEYNAGEMVGEPKNTDDKIIVGYTSDGLPFKIVVDGFFGRTTSATFKFIDEYVTPLMDEYAEKLSESNDPETVIKELIHRIYGLRYMKDSPPEFTMSIGITYKKGNQLQCAGFGIGDTGLVLRKTDGTIQQLTYTTEVDDFKDAFDRSSFLTGIDRVINRNSVFNVPVEPGDEIFGYTYLMEELLSDENEFVENYQVNDRYKQNKIKHKKISAAAVGNVATLFEAVKKANSEFYSKRCGLAEEDKKTLKFGDGCMLSTVTIATKELQNKLKKAAYDQEKERLLILSHRINNKDINSSCAELLVLATAQEQENSDNDLPALTRNLAASSRALIKASRQNIDSLLIRAQNMQGKPSKGIQALGIGMMALGAILAGIGGLFIAGGLCALPSVVFLPQGVAGIAAGSCMAAGGVALFSAGLGFFRYGHQKKGISKIMTDLSHNVIQLYN